MGQIVKRKKKGRPSKVDLAQRGSDTRSSAKESEPRRSHRRRSVRYNLSYDDDFIDEDYEEFDEDDEEDERARREKKLKFVLDSGEAELQLAARGVETSEQSASEDEEERKIVKKRKIDTRDYDDEEDEEIEIENGNGNGIDEIEKYDEEETEGDDLSKSHVSAPGTPRIIPLPDKKTLEFVLHKLQKKDTYGVFAEPVDPEELPDYYDVIEHAMDFATVRKKLGNESYSTLEQFESDICLLCSNAMQYNAPDTVYFKQANTIQELAKRKFQKLRNDFERSERETQLSEKEIKTEQIQKPVFLATKQTRKLLGHTMQQEPVGSDFSSGATLATAGEVPNGSTATQAGGSERPSNTDALVDVNTSMVDNSLEKIEEFSSGKGLLSKLGKRSSVIDENRRSTYNISCEPDVKPGSIFTTFEGEIKQLVAVGLQAEYAYGRSLARFAASLGPVAWKVVSKRIEQALPSGCKFGRGWVGEYEPLPTPVLMIESRNRKESASVTKTQATIELSRENVSYNTPAFAKEHSVNGRVSSGDPSFFHPAAGPTTERKPHISRPTAGPSEGNKPSSHLNVTHKRQNTQSRNSGEPANGSSKQVELNFPPSANQNNSNIVTEKHQSMKSEIPSSRSRETLPRKTNVVQSIPPQPLNNNGVIAGGLPKGTVQNNSMTRSPSDQMVRSTMYPAPVGQEQGLSDPVKLMKMLSKEQDSSSQTPINTTAAKPVVVPSIKREDSGNAAAAAARAWMSIGAGGFKQPTENPNSPRNQISAESLYNSAREFPPQISRIRAEFPLPLEMQFQAEKNGMPFAPQPVRPGSEQQFQNRPPMIFPQFVAADFSRFQMQSPWGGMGPHSQPSLQGQSTPRAQPRPKQETLPPDLNIGFQHPGSPPMKRSSGVFVDSQQPDLALQL